jgi:hypothetical protein
VRLLAREVMLRIVKLQRSEVCFTNVVAHLTSLCGKAAILHYAVRHNFTWRSQTSLIISHKRYIIEKDNILCYN